MRFARSRAGIWIGSLVLLLLFSFGSSPVAQSSQETVPPVDDSHLTLNVHLAQRPAQIDPAYVVDTLQANVVEQIFGGLVDRNDATNEIEPELASGWTASPDGLTYTFELHPNQRWSDGSPLTADDVRYSLIRVLNPQTASPDAELFYIIRGAQEFHQGATDDVGSIGIIAESASRLRIELTAPSRLFLDILTSPAAKVVPQSAIETYGPNWTLPENLLSSGPYRLISTDDTRFVYEKNMAYVRADQVQIARINQRFIADDSEIWSEYLNGSLDTAPVPSDVTLSPTLVRQTLRIEQACTYFYGFNSTIPPFDDVRVRQAFMAAIGRRGLVQQVVPYAAAARTFTPQNVVSHTDGYAQNIGIGYDPTQARGWLADAGYADGIGLPTIDLWHNESAGHAAIADYVARQWRTVLGAQVTVHSIPWSELLEGIEGGDLMVWRGGWCADYPDAVNFLGDGVESYRNGLGGWRNTTYDEFIMQARSTTDRALLDDLYAGAEEILVETNAVLAPLYYYGSRIATQPYLSHPPGYAGLPDYAEWELTRTRTGIAAEGGDAESADGGTTVEIADDTFSQAVIMAIEPTTAVPPAVNKRLVGSAYQIEALDPASGEIVSIAEEGTVTISFSYAGMESGVSEESIALYFWDGAQWRLEPTSAVDMAADVVRATPDHLSQWALFGETNRVFVPAAAR